MIFKYKLRAALWHFLITAAVGALIAALVFLVWFPPPFAAMMDGIKLFFIVLGCDLALGPLMSLVIYNHNKSRRELIIDYLIIGAIQLAALVYGVFVVAQYRPAYIAFTVDRFDVISAGDLTAEDLKQAALPQYRHAPWFGPQLVAVIKPQNAEDQYNAIFLALGGKDISARPKFYRPYDSRRDDIIKAIQPLSTLFTKHPDRQTEVMNAIKAHHLNTSSAGWVPVKHRRGFWIALMNISNAMPVAYLPIDPY
ncbi:MAG: TfpX/TfpZ family type IV pilin accessory protein [Steroidobacter sp.]